MVDCDHQMVVLTTRAQQSSMETLKSIEVIIWDPIDTGRVQVGDEIEVTGMLTTQIEPKDGKDKHEENHTERIRLISHHVEWKRIGADAPLALKRQLTFRQVADKV